MVKSCYRFRSPGVKTSPIHPPLELCFKAGWDPQRIRHHWCTVFRCTSDGSGNFTEKIPALRPSPFQLELGADSLAQFVKTFEHHGAKDTALFTRFCHNALTESMCYTSLSILDADGVPGVSLRPTEHEALGTQRLIAPSQLGFWTSNL